MLPLVCFWVLLISPGFQDPLQPVRVAMEGQDWDGAIAKLELLESDFPEAYQWNHLAYLKGVLLKRGGFDRRAQAALDAIAESSFPMADYALLHLIDLAEGSLDEQAGYVERFLKRFPDHPRWSQTALDYGRALGRAERWAEAKHWLDQVWRRGSGSLSRQAALEHALIHLDLDENREAINDLERLLVKSERDDVAFRAARELHRLQPATELHEGEARRRARVFLNNRDGATAREYLRYLIEKFPRSLARDQYAYLWARTLDIQGRLQAARAAYLEAYRQHPSSSWGVYSRYLAGNLALRAKDYPEAENDYRWVVQRHSSSRYAARAWFNLADTYRWLGRPDEARRTLLQALGQIRGSEQRQFRYALARADLEAGDFTSALTQLERLDHLSSLRLPSGVTREEIHFWKGFALDRLGRFDEARAAFRTAAGGSPNYFAFLSRARLAERGDRIPAAADEPWLARLISPRPWRREPPPPSLSPAGRIQELLFFHLFDEAALEVKRAGRAACGGDRVAQLFNLAYYADRGNLAEESIRAAELLQGAVFREKDPAGYPRVIQSLLYPRHFWELVSRYGRAHQVEPELILSVIRQESRFQSHAKSIAAARGLMQFMNSTARELAGELRLKAPSESDLYDPELSVRLGAYYLQKLLRRYDGSLEKALAAYNGGPDNVERWASKIPFSSPELFVSNIGFRETKLYVLKVMGNYFIYKRLYQTEAPALGEPAKTNQP